MLHKETSSKKNKKKELITPSLILFEVLLTLINVREDKLETGILWGTDGRPAMQKNNQSAKWKVFGHDHCIKLKLLK